MTPSLSGVRSGRSRAQLAALLKVQAKLSLREPQALGVGVGLPAILLIVFGFISRNVPGNVGGTGLTVIDLYIPVIMLFFALMFLSGLWVQPDLVGGPLHVILLYSPSGAAVRALLYSMFGQAPTVTILAALVGYTVVFAFAAVRYFRWE